ncbi:MAG TPA: DNA-processing protein DprA [Candidatus Obscuribacter sp.]|nr:DNA-processing protein DprA [Candidatus Obscuribacter sp.]
MLQTDNSLAIMKLLRVPGLGPSKVNALLDWGKRAGRSPVELCNEPDLLKSRLTAEQIDSMQLDQSSLGDDLAREEIRLISVLDDSYPNALRRSLNGKTPPLLYCRGNIDLLSKPAVGFCGARKASDRGLDTARDCADQLASHGFVVVSGYAAGVDITTHIAALSAGGTTVIVLPEGILRFRIKQEINSVWDWERVLVVSHLDPTLSWSVHNAMARNAVICGLSNAMILIEAGTTGGSIAAGRTCLDMGRPLFAPVYETMPETAAGNRLLLSQGARPLLKSRHTHRAAIERVLHAISRSDSPSNGSEQISLFA